MTVQAVLGQLCSVKLLITDNHTWLFGMVKEVRIVV